MKKWLLKVWGVTARIAELEEQVEVTEECLKEQTEICDRLNLLFVKKEEQIRELEGDKEKLINQSHRDQQKLGTLQDRVEEWKEKFVEAVNAALAWKEKAESKSTNDLLSEIERKVSEEVG